MDKQRDNKIPAEWARLTPQEMFSKRQYAQKLCEEVGDLLYRMGLTKSAREEWVSESKRHIKLIQENAGQLELYIAMLEKNRDAHARDLAQQRIQQSARDTAKKQPTTVVPFPQGPTTVPGKIPMSESVQQGQARGGTESRGETPNQDAGIEAQMYTDVNFLKEFNDGVNLLVGKKAHKAIYRRVALAICRKGDYSVNGWLRTLDIALVLLAHGGALGTFEEEDAKRFFAENRQKLKDVFDKAKEHYSNRKANRAKESLSTEGALEAAGLSKEDLKKWRDLQRMGRLAFSVAHMSTENSTLIARINTAKERAHIFKLARERFLSHETFIAWTRENVAGFNDEEPQYTEAVASLWEGRSAHDARARFIAERILRPLLLKRVPASFDPWRREALMNQERLNVLQQLVSGNVISDRERERYVALYKKRKDDPMYAFSVPQRVLLDKVDYYIDTKPGLERRFEKLQQLVSGNVISARELERYVALYKKRKDDPTYAFSVPQRVLLDKVGYHIDTKPGLEKRFEEPETRPPSTPDVAIDFPDIQSMSVEEKQAERLRLLKMLGRA